MTINVDPYSVSVDTTTTQPTARTNPTTASNTVAAYKSHDAGAQEGVSLSITGRQLAQSAIAAERRDASLSRSELGAEAKRLRDQFIGSGYNKERAAREVPDTDNPVLLARAKQATAYVQQYGRNPTVENPFSHLSTEQLTLIMYDDSGRYTKNERHAAWLEQYDRRQVWNQKVVAQAHIEYNATGQNDRFYQAVIDHYHTLPLIEQAQLPANYVSHLQFWIDNNQPPSDGNYLALMIEQFMAARRL